jgi:hypothetical protein
MAQTLNEGEEDSIWAKSIHYAVTDEKDQYLLLPPQIGEVVSHHTILAFGVTIMNHLRF